MILIISSTSDIITNEVINWLLYFKHDFLRISEEDAVEVMNVSISNTSNDTRIKIRNKEYRLNDFTSIWYRRSFIKAQKNELVLEDKDLQHEINKQLSAESVTLYAYLLKAIANKSINKQSDTSLNKMEALSLAAICGIDIPDTLITSNKKELADFIKKHKHVITKNFTPGVFVKQQDNFISTYTRVVSDEILRTMPDSFFPMMFQQMIKKEFELRIFFIKDSFYSSAIFSQKDEQTSVDFRNYNDVKANRTPPYKLPKDIEEKLYTLMSKLGLNSGSIDLVVTPEGKYIFLEVNPIGQFAQVSVPCNYYLEKKMAMELMNGI